MNYLDKTYDKFLKAIYLKLEYLLVRGGFKSFQTKTKLWTILLLIHQCRNLNNILS